MARAFPYLSGFALPIALVAGVRLGGAWTFFPLVLLLVFLPVADWAAGLNLANPDEDDDALSENRWFRAVTWLWVPVHVAILIWAIEQASSGRLSGVELAGLTLSLGIIAGSVGITFAHELVHRPGRFEVALGEILLSATCYTHFTIEHVYGHHRHVGTPRDPATARFGEPLYAFIPRCVAGSLMSAWRFETGRLARRGRAVWHPSNRMIRYAATGLAIYAAITAAWGAAGALFFTAQAVLAFSLLETINYIEHYGLERRELAPGRYERVMPWHSWNSSHRLSNWLLINLARHSDHHLVASKRYQMLEHVDAAPQLPAGYGAMFLMALVPPLWRRIMDPRVSEWRRLCLEHQKSGSLSTLKATPIR
jgi:alkane 1-monooxygenase